MDFRDPRENPKRRRLAAAGSSVQPGGNSCRLSRDLSGTRRRSPTRAY